MKSLSWRIQRMRMMSPLELGIRTSREVRNLLDHVLLTTGVSPRSLSSEIPCGEETKGFPFRGRFFFDPQDEFLRARLGPLSARYINEADDALAHRVSLLGQSYDLGRDIDWHYDYRLGRRCPNRYSSFIDLKDPGFEESIRWVWYFNRHKHLGALGRAYFVTQKKEYGQEILRQLCAWIEQNPPCVGVNWTAPLEIALRLFSWMWAIFPLKNFDGFTPLVQRTIARSIALQMRYMFRNLSTYSSANNHLVTQAMTLFVVGTLLSDASEAEKWRNKGLSILWQEILGQTYSDGVSKEHSFHYHCFVCELYAVALIFAERNGVDIPFRVKERFARMCDFLLSVASEDGKMPAVGDSDDQTVVLPANERGLFEGLMVCASSVTGESRFAHRLNDIPLEAALLIGNEGLERLQAKARDTSDQNRLRAIAEKDQRATIRSSKVFSEGGYCILADESNGIESWCVFDCGELGLGKTAAHGHADCLSVAMMVNGRDVLIDPGTFTYHSRPEWRAYFRSTNAHNTVTVDGLSQSEMLGPFVWGPRAAPKLEDVAMEGSFDFVAGSHDGYQRLSNPVKHKRVLVLVKPAFFIIVDSLTTRGRHQYEQNFHLNGEASLSTEEGLVRVSSGGAGFESLLLSPLLARGLGALLSGQEKPIVGWRSRVFWQKEPCQCLSIKGEFRGPLLLESCILNIPSGDSQRQVVSFSNSNPEGRVYSLVKRKTPLYSETSLINLSNGQAGERCLESDAAYLCVREFPASGALEIFGRNVGRVLRNGEPLVEAPEKFAFMKVRIEEEKVRFEARGAGTVLVRAPRSANVVSSIPIVDYTREGDFIRISAET
jgi:hypothetical protein